MQEPGHNWLPKTDALHWSAGFNSIIFIFSHWHKFFCNAVSEGTKKYDGARTEEEMLKFLARFIEDRVRG